MEQRLCVDRTPVSEAQAFAADAFDERDLDAAATKLLTKPAATFSLGDAIETHRAARAALNEACCPVDEVAVLAAGGDTSDEAMAPARAAWETANEREIRAFEALLACRPTDPAGLAQMLAYIAESPALGDLDDSTDAVRNIAAAAANVAKVDARASVSPAVMLAASEAWNAYVAIWKADKEWAAGQITEEAWKIVYERAHETLDRLSMVEAKTWLDMACKCLVLGAEEAWELSTTDVPAEDGRIKRIGRQFETMILAGGQANLPAPCPTVVDPIFPLIEEGRRLLAISDAAFAIEVPAGTNTPPEVEDAVTTALHNLVDHCRGVLLQTVPLTAAGCRELARFAVEYFEHQDVPIDDDQQAVTSLIARSPLIGSAAVPPQQDELQVSAATMTSPVDPASADLSSTCDALLERLAWLDRPENTERMTEDAWSDELAAWAAVFRRAISEPSNSLRDFAAKARLMLADMDRFDPASDDDKDDKRLMRVILCEAIVLKPAAPSLLNELLDAWGEWAKTCPDGSTPDDEVALKRNEDARDRLISEVAALPATRENAVAKGIAGAWVEYLNSWEENAPRDSYGIDGRLCFDIHDAVTLAAVA